MERRGPRTPVDPRQPAAAFVEEERTEDGRVVPVATLFLVNRECPWRCLMCDLWKSTTTETAAPGVIPEQIRAALARLPPLSRVKVYNAGSFFDPRAIPVADLPEIARALHGRERVIVECHPALVSADVERFRDLLDGDLEVAMGLETVHPEVLPLLNKGMTLDDFRRAADRLAAARVALRAFVLLGLPFLARGESVSWAVRSADYAFDSGATAVTIIPTRAGNGAMEALGAAGHFEPPTLDDLEDALAAGISLRRGRVFADLWDLETLRTCSRCFSARRERLAAVNRDQADRARVACDRCGEGV
ncbi:MAG: radical SAM protein [Acidobacteriota bacterium]|nr:radical SAM protein [Acidobacteriota bacterium]